HTSQSVIQIRYVLPIQHARSVTVGEMKCVNDRKELDPRFCGKRRHMPFEHRNHIIKVLEILFWCQRFPILVYSHRTVGMGLGKVQQGSQLARWSARDVAPHKLIDKRRLAYSRRAFNNQDSAPGRVTDNWC